MVNYARITTEEAERARRLWLAIAAEFTRPTTRCPAGRLPQARMPGDPRPRDDETWPGGPVRRANRRTSGMTAPCSAPMGG